VAIPSFHDCQVTSIALGDNVATVGLRKPDGSAYELILGGLEALQVDDFRQGNIVFDVAVITSLQKTEEPSFRELLERLFPGPHTQAADHFHEAHATFLAQKIAKVSSAEAVLLTITPSYGCDLVAYCASAELRGEAG
jgi:hypothetical protein